MGILGGMYTFKEKSVFPKNHEYGINRGINFKYKLKKPWWLPLFIEPILLPKFKVPNPSTLRIRGMVVISIQTFRLQYN